MGFSIHVDGIIEVNIDESSSWHILHSDDQHIFWVIIYRKLTFQKKSTFKRLLLRNCQTGIHLKGINSPGSARPSIKLPGRIVKDKEDKWYVLNISTLFFWVGGSPHYLEVQHAVQFFLNVFGWECLTIFVGQFQAKRKNPSFERPSWPLKSKPSWIVFQLGSSFSSCLFPPNELDKYEESNLK